MVFRHHLLTGIRRCYNSKATLKVTLEYKVVIAPENSYRNRCKANSATHQWQWEHHPSQETMVTGGGGNKTWMTFLWVNQKVSRSLFSVHPDSNYNSFQTRKWSAVIPKRSGLGERATVHFTTKSAHLCRRRHFPCSYYMQAQHWQGRLPFSAPEELAHLLPRPGTALAPHWSHRQSHSCII